MSGDGNMVAFNVLWKMMVGMGALGLGLAGILYAGQLDMDEDKVDKEVFFEYKKDNRQYLVDNNERIEERFDSLDDKVDDGFEQLKKLIELEHK